MVQTVKSRMVYSGWKVCLLEKPLVLNRIFFNITVLFDATMDCQARMSLGDPRFSTYYTLNNQVFYFEARGEGIFQGDVWVENVSPSDLLFVRSEILV